MNHIDFQHLLGRIELGIFALLAIFGTVPLFVLAFVFIAIGLVVRTWLLGNYSGRIGTLLTISYVVLMILELVFLFSGLFPTGSTAGHPIHRIIAAVLVPLPLLIERVIPINEQGKLDWPSVSETSTISFADLSQGQDQIEKVISQAKKAQQAISLDNLHTILSDLHRHSSTHYINNGSLTDKYFELADDSLSDPYLYLIISNTGSPASELIALFTQKQFNHASLSFDRELKTTISYNGGERVYPPGLNSEMIASFHQKADASVLVYRLPVTLEQKRQVLDTIRNINETGSAYNILGLVTKHSLRRNIMFCSQFVYRMLQIGHITYFDKAPGNVQPTDFVELDYYRRLEFVEKIKF